MQKKTVRIIGVVLALLLAAGCDEPPRQEPTAELIEVQKIWGGARHNAFTDLVRFKDRWYCVFREAQDHRSSDGALRVITSADGDEWFSASLVPPEPGHDLRDPHLTVTPDNRLMLIGGDFEPAGTGPRGFHSTAWFSSDGENWGDPIPVIEPMTWLWRVTWHEGIAYGLGYAWGNESLVRLYKSSDGAHFEVLVERLFDRGQPNESSIVFLEDGTAFCLLRRDGEEEHSAQLGTSSPPYTEWTWKDLGLRLGGPDLLYLPDGRWVATGRLYENEGEIRAGRWWTSLLWLDPKLGTLTEFLELPSGGDTSYPGLVFHNDLLWVSYYSGHENEGDLNENRTGREANIYLAKVKLPPAQ